MTYLADSHREHFITRLTRQYLIIAGPPACLGLVCYDLNTSTHTDIQTSIHRETDRDTYRHKDKEHTLTMVNTIAQEKTATRKHLEKEICKKEECGPDATLPKETEKFKFVAFCCLVKNTHKIRTLFFPGSVATYFRCGG